MTDTLTGEVGSGGITLTTFTNHNTLEEVRVQGLKFTERGCNSLGSTGSDLTQLYLFSYHKPLLEVEKEFICQRADVGTRHVVNNLQHSSLVALREGVEEQLRLLLTGCCLAVGEARLTRQRTCPHITVAEEMSVEEPPAERGEELG